MEYFGPYTFVHLFVWSIRSNFGGTRSCREARDDNSENTYFILVVRCMTPQMCVFLGISNILFGDKLAFQKILSTESCYSLKGNEGSMFISV